MCLITTMHDKVKKYKVSQQTEHAKVSHDKVNNANVSQQTEHAKVCHDNEHQHKYHVLYPVNINIK